MEKTWYYKNFQIHEGMKPQASNFQYFFRVFDGTEKICNYCVWIEDNALLELGPSMGFEAVVSSYGKGWRDWVKKNLDRKNFRNLVLKHSQEGNEEIDLGRTKEKISMD